MASPVPTPPPEAVLIRNARLAAGIRQPEAVALLASRGFRFSASRWSQIEIGREGTRENSRAVTGSAVAIAQMAAVVGVTPERLRAVRPDAAEILDEILLQQGAASAAIPKPSVSASGEVASPAGEAELDAFGAMLTREYPEFADLVETLRSEPSLTAGEKLGLMTMARILRQARGDANDRTA
jgi:hypothetical protein